MMETLPTGQLAKATVTANLVHGLRVQLDDGAPGHLAVVTEEGRIVHAGAQVDDEVFCVVLKAYNDFLNIRGVIRRLK